MVGFNFISFRFQIKGGKNPARRNNVQERIHFNVCSFDWTQKIFETIVTDHKIGENDQPIEFKWKMLNIDLSMVEKEEQYIIGRVTNDQTFQTAWFSV